MKIKHQGYTARIDDGKVYVTVAGKTLRIDDLPTVLRIYEHIDDKQPLEAWRLIGRVTGDVYLQGVK